MQNKKIISYIIITLGFIVLAVSAVFLIKSIEVYSDEWGTDISLNQDLVMLLLVSLIIIANGFYSFNLIKQNKELNKVNFLTYCAVFLIISLYCFGVFAKAMFKGKEYAAYQIYLYCGIINLIVTIIGLIFTNKKFKNLKTN